MNKSAFSFLSQLTTWHGPQLLLRAVLWRGYGAADRRPPAVQQSIDIFRPPGPQQQTRSSGGGRMRQTDRRTDARQLHAPHTSRAVPTKRKQSTTPHIINRDLNDETGMYMYLLILVDWFSKLDDVAHGIVFVHVHHVQKVLVAIEFQLRQTGTLVSNYAVKFNCKIGIPYFYTILQKCPRSKI